MPTTLYKGYSVPTTGTEPGTWGTDLNTNTFSAIDANLGGIVTIGLTNVNVTLTAAQAQNLIVRLTGALTGNVNVIIPGSGLTIVENATSGAFYVSVVGGIGAAQYCPQGQASLYVFDTTNGCALVGQDIASGSIMVFRQSNAPVGWTKITTVNDYGMRVVSGTVSAGGSIAYSGAFAARTIAIGNLPAHNHTYGDAGHGHAQNAGLGVGGYGLTSGGGYVNQVMVSGLSGLSTGISTTGISINNTGSGTALDFNVLTIDVILAQRN